MNGKKLVLILAAPVLLLTGCVPAVFVAGAAAGTAAGTVIYNNRTMKSMVQDKDIAFDAQSLIDKDSDLKFKSHIIVTSFNGIVLLVGQSPNSEYRNRAVHLVQSVKGVKRIYNEIVIAKPTTASQRSKDVWITTKVKTALLATKGLESTQIKVVTEKRTVFLLGLVMRSQGDLAARATSKVSGVRKVVKLFEYLH